MVLLGFMLCLILVSFVIALGQGSVDATLGRVLGVVLHQLGLMGPLDPQDPILESVIMQIRLPRMVLALVVGAGLGLGGALMQGVFRNPLADPGLIGVSSGGALAASLFIVFAGGLTSDVGGWVRLMGTPVMAFAGALGVTYLVWHLGTVGGRVLVSRLLLAGIAINALAGAAIGCLTLVATDTELRDLIFWSLGSLNGATWTTVLMSALGVLPAVLLAPRLARSLDAWLLGEVEAQHLGVDVVQLKRRAVGVTALAVGTAVAAAGIIGFVGLVIPHMIRLLLGPGHRYLLPGSALLGAWLLMGADVFARLVASPLEIPIGVVTALVGAPFFLLLLRRNEDAGLVE